MLQKATYTLLIAGLLFAVCISGYQIYRTSSTVVLNRLYENIEISKSNEVSISNPLRLSDSEKDILLSFYPYRNQGGDFLLKKLKKEKDPQKKLLILKILPEMGCSNCAIELVTYTGAYDYRMKTLALTALQKLKYEGMLELLYGIIEKNEHGKVTPWAIFLLAEIGDDSDVRFILSLSQKEGYQSKPMQRAINVALAEFEKRGLAPNQIKEQE